MNQYDITGEHFGNWTVLKRDKPHKGKQNSYWICKCICGTTRTVSRSSLISGRSISCGCAISDKRKGINKTHGMSKTRLYHEWVAMRRRCKDDKGRCSKSYFKKGISVCEEWENSFENFMEWSNKNGYSDNLTIDRINNDDGYNPNNCRWVTIEEQQQNKSNNIFIQYNGQQWCLRTLCKEIGFPYKTAHLRYKRAVNSGKEISTEKLFSPIQTNKIAKKYRS